MLNTYPLAMIDTRLMPQRETVIAVARSALSTSSSAPSARRHAALELDRSARPSGSSGRAGFAVTTIGE
jgi:hypothetical protein